VNEGTNNRTVTEFISAVSSTYQRDVHPIHIVRLDERTLNLFILAGQNEEIELEIQPNGSIEP
jgi:hypothetical protein